MGGIGKALACMEGEYLPLMAYLQDVIGTDIMPRVAAQPQVKGHLHGSLIHMRRQILVVLGQLAGKVFIDRGEFLPIVI